MTIPSISQIPNVYVNNTRPVDHAYFLEWITAQQAANDWYIERTGGGTAISTIAMDYDTNNPATSDPVRLPLTTIGSKLCIVDELSAAGDMWGTPWGGSFKRAGGGQVSSNNRVVQHCCPSQAAFDAIVSNNSRVILDTFVWPADNHTPPVAGLNRNGYSSAAATVAGSTAFFGVYDMLFWDFASSQAMLIRPYKMVNAVPFNLRKDQWPIPLP